MIFLIVSYPVGRLNFAYTPPPDDQTPLVLKIFNPTFWALAELWLGVWAANLPPCAPLLRNMDFQHPYERISNAYRRIWSRGGSSTADASRDVKTPFSDGTGGSSENSRRKPSEALVPNHEDSSVPLVPISAAAEKRKRGMSVTSEYPPSLSPMEFTGTGRLSVLIPPVESQSPSRFR